MTAASSGRVVRPRLLVVEDDDTIAVPLEEGLAREGFEVARVSNGSEALVAVAGGTDLVLLDLGLPDLDGTEVCRRLRAASTVPIIVLTARGDEVDRVLLLELGADDYVVKPFGFRELVARIRAVNRRTAAAVPSGEGDGTPGQQIGSLVIDRRARRVHRAGDEVHLTPKEFDLLARLADDPGAVVRRDDLMAEIWDEHWWGSTKTLDVHVASLRKKLAGLFRYGLREPGARLLHALLTAAAGFEHARLPELFCGFSAEEGPPAGEVYPAMVVRVFGPSVTANLQVFLDGNDSYWATSRVEGDEPYQWSWPPRV